VSCVCSEREESRGEARREEEKRKRAQERERRGREERDIYPGDITSDLAEGNNLGSDIRGGKRREGRIVSVATIGTFVSTSSCDSS
jgi:hypothetical protein